MSNPSEKAMEYIRIYGSLLTHPKMKDLVDYLQEHKEKRNRPEIVGCYVILLAMVAEHYNDGQIRDDVDPVRRVARLSDWAGDPKTWVDGLVHAQFLDKNDDGFYVHNWMEKHARDWWAKQESHQHKKRLARERSARFRAGLRDARNQAKYLKEKYEGGYEATLPPLQEERNAKTALLTRDAALRNVANADPQSDERDVFLPPPETPKIERLAQEVMIALPSEKGLTMNEVHDFSVTNALGGVASRASRTNSSSSRTRVTDKDKGLRESAEGTLAPADPALDPERTEATHQSCIDLWYALHKAHFEGEEFSNGGYLAKIVAKRSKQGYGEVEQRMRNWWASTYQRIIDLRFALSEFDRKWSELKEGPLVNFEKPKGRQVYGELDKRKDQFQTTDDFGTTESGVGERVEGKTPGG